jgi:hypothetical protein
MLGSKISPVPESRIQSSEAEDRLSMERWRDAAAPLERQIQEANRTAVTLAVTGLRAMFMLNGGALLVFPAYLTLMDTDLDAAFALLVMGFSAFLAGLIFAALATLLGYFTEIYRARGAAHAYEAAGMKFRGAVAGGAAAPVAAVIAKHEAEEARAARIGSRLRAAAICLAVLSLISFCGGAYFAAGTLMTGPAQSDESTVRNL